MPDKVIKALDDAPNPLPTDWYIAVGEPGGDGEAFRKPISEFIAQILPANDAAIKVFYVDGNNAVIGDGSITNPFKTLELAYNKVLGTGTPDNPQYQNVLISVNANTYNTALNLYMLNVSWDFADGTVINYTGTGYLIDTSPFINCNGIFRISGGARIIINNGGFIKNHGAGFSQQYQKWLDIEFYECTGFTALGATVNPTLSQPLIWLSKTTSGGGYSSPYTKLTIKNRLLSYSQTTVYVQGALHFTATGGVNGGIITYGSNNNVIYPYDVRGRCLRYENNETGMRRSQGGITIDNIIFASGGVDGDYEQALIHLEGAISFGYMRDCTIDTGFGDAKVDRAIEIFDIESIPYGSGQQPGLFAIIGMKFDSRLTYMYPDIVRFIGTDSTKNKLNMINCIMPAGCKVNANVNIGGSIGTMYNVFNGIMNISNVSTYANNAAALAGGLMKGDVYRTSDGDLKIAY